MEVKRIKYERTGGFTGMRMAAEIEPQKLSEDEIRTLVDLIDDVDFNELPKEMLNGSGADQFTYTITVETRKWEHTVTIGDSSAHGKMSDLLELLNRLARKKMMKK
jgi:hypothetical protein